MEKEELEVMEEILKRTEEMRGVDKCLYCPMKEQYRYFTEILEKESERLERLSIPEYKEESFGLLEFFVFLFLLFLGLLLTLGVIEISKYIMYFL